MILKQIPELKLLLSTPKSIVIVCHKNPDGDAMGSTLGLCNYLKLYKHNAVVITPNDCPQFLKWLPGSSAVKNYEAETEQSSKLISDADIIFTLDFNALHRVGESMSLCISGSKAIKIMIDHHQQPDDYASYMYSDVQMSSTCEMVYNFIEMLGDEAKISTDIGTCIYTGIMTDTGSFRFASTTSRTHTIVGKLIDKGIQNAYIHQKVYDENSINRLHLLGRALQNLTVLPKHRTAYITLSQSDLDEFHFTKGDTEGFVNYALSIKNIIFAAIFIENKQEAIIKISLRSKGDFSVNQFSRTHFNGGGHNNAAGGKSTLSLTETVNKFVSILPTYNNQLNQ